MMQHEGDWQDDNVLLSVPLRYVEDVAKYKAALMASRGA